MLHATRDVPRGVRTITDPVTGRAFPVPAGGADDDPEPVEVPEEDPAPEDDPEPFDEERARAKIAKANSEAANLRRRLKEAEAKAAKLDELEDANKSDIERANERLTAAEQRALEAEQRAWRLEVAAEKGLTPAQARRLVGTSKEELEQDADDLLATFDLSREDDGRTRPKERLKPGASRAEEPEADPDEIADRILSRNRI